MTILIAIPYLPSMPQPLHDRMRACADALYEANVGAVEIVLMDGTVPVPPRSPRYTGHAKARNKLIDTYLKPHHDHVLWIDSDLVAYPPELPALLLGAADGVVAPLVVIEDSQSFYDTHGFVAEDGRPFEAAPPYARERGNLIPCQAVGCCYLLPASVYRDGARYTTTPHQTEHFSICQAARARGLPVQAVRSIRVAHANLPRYGLPWN